MILGAHEHQTKAERRTAYLQCKKNEKRNTSSMEVAIILISQKLGNDSMMWFVGTQSTTDSGDLQMIVRSKFTVSGQRAKPWSNFNSATTTPYGGILVAETLL